MMALVRRVFNGTVSVVEVILASNEKRYVQEARKDYKRNNCCSFDVLFQHSPRGTNKNHENPQSGQSVPLYLIRIF